MDPLIGKRKDPDLFGKLEAVEVLSWYDGPRTFTLLDADGGLCLAHWLDEERDSMRFVVVPVRARDVEQLQRGSLTLLEVLDQPRVYVVDQENTGQVREVWLTTLAALPMDALPDKGVTLNRDAQSAGANAA